MPNGWMWLECRNSGTTQEHDYLEEHDYLQKHQWWKTTSICFWLKKVNIYKTWMNSNWGLRFKEMMLRYNSNDDEFICLLSRWEHGFVAKLLLVGVVNCHILCEG
jgi:hypothetical protein